MRPTPETDARCVAPVSKRVRAWVDVDFARRLERERDEARETIANLCWQLGKCEGIATGILQAGEFSPDKTPPLYEPLHAALAVSTLREQRDRLAEAVASFVRDFEHVDWGWDGDCGAQCLVNSLKDNLAAVKGGSDE